MLESQGVRKAITLRVQLRIRELRACLNQPLATHFSFHTQVAGVFEWRDPCQIQQLLLAAFPAFAR